VYNRKAFAEGIGEGYTPQKGINPTFEVDLWLNNYKELDIDYEHLLKLDVKLPSGESITFPKGIRCLNVSDPEGNLIKNGNAVENR
jgi:hypothetical protein